MKSVLAKAVGQRSDDPDALLAYADRTVTDATEMGIIAGHISAGDLKAAKTALLEIGERTQVAKAAEVMGQAVGAGLEDDMATYDSRAGMSELTARFGALERMLSSLEARLAAIERRPQAAAPVDVDDDEQLVVKAAVPKRKRTPEEEADYLMGQIDAYVDSPNVVGTLSSMVAAGEFKQVRAAVARAKQAHESARLVNERKTWSQ